MRVPAPMLVTARFGATIVDDILTAAALLAGIQRATPEVEAACRVA